MHAQLRGLGGTFVGTLSGGANYPICPISGLALKSDGHNGFTCNSIRVLAATWYASVAASTKPKFMFLHAGTNDMINLVTGTETMPQAIANFNAMFARLLSLDSMMVFLVGTVMKSNFGDVIVPFNDNVAAQIAAATAAGRRVYLVDLYEALTPVVDFDPGKVHPNNAGYVKEANCWMNVLLDALADEARGDA